MDYTILLQGRIEKRAMDFWKNNFSHENICVSIWEDDIEYDFPNQWKVIKSKKPYERIGYKNFDLQLISTINGLDVIDTEYVIKMRCDEYWSNIDEILKMINEDDGKIICGSLFFRAVGMHPFHISDHILAGKLENLKIMFNSAYENLKNNFWNFPIPECQLGLAYLLAKEIDFKNKIIDVNLYESHKPNVLENFNDNNEKEIIEKYLSQINYFTERIKYELSVNTINWKNIKKFTNSIEFVNNNIKLRLQKSEYPKIDELSILRKHFKIINVDLLKPFLCTCTINHLGERAWYESKISEFDKQNCITTL